MLLRSSSTPVLGSLLSSFSESPNNHHHSEPQPTIKHPTPPTIHHHHHNISPVPLSYSSPIAHSVVEFSSGGSFRRSQSEGNLANLDDNHQFINGSFSKPPKYLPRKFAGSALETIPSFSFHNSLRHEEEDKDSDGEEEEEYDVEKESVEFLETSNNETRFSNSYKSLGLEEMYLARGLGVDNLNIGFGGVGGGGGGDFIPLPFGRDGGDGKRQGAEEHYKSLVEENPGNPLFLRNYAQFLFESKKDLAKSEELYSRAILADPGDGEVLSQYAKLIWELHQDQDRALSYFERAVQAAPADSHVHAAYASFLWDIEGEEGEDEDTASVYNPSMFNSHFHQGSMASAST